MKIEKKRLAIFMVFGLFVAILLLLYGTSLNAMSDEKFSLAPEVIASSTSMPIIEVEGAPTSIPTQALDLMPREILVVTNHDHEIFYLNSSCLEKEDCYSSITPYLGDMGGIKSYPAFSNDGSKFFYYHSVDMSSNISIMIVDLADMSSVHQLTNSGRIYGAFWSETGESVFYFQSSNSGTEYFKSFNLITFEDEIIASNSNQIISGEYVWLPSENNLFFCRVQEGEDYVGDFYAYDLDQREEKRFGFDFGISINCFSNYSFSSDGSKILFVGLANGSAVGDIYTYEMLTNELIQWTFENGIDSVPEFSPDNSRIAFMSNETGSFEIYVLEQGGDLHQITNNNSWNGVPQWGNNGLSIYYISNQNGGERQLYVINLTTMTEYQLTTIEGGILSFELFP